MRRFEKRANELLAGLGPRGLQPALEGLPTGELVAVLAGITGDGDERRYLRNVLATEIQNRLGAQETLLGEVLAPPTEAEPERLASALARAMRSDLASIEAADAARLSLGGSHGLTKGMRDAPAGQEPLRMLGDEVLRRGEPLVVTDLAADPGWADSPAWRQFGIRSYAGAPAVDGVGDVGGVAWVASYRARTYSPEEMRLLGRLARRAAWDVPDGLPAAGPSFTDLGPVFAAPPAQRIVLRPPRGHGRVLRLADR